MTNEDLVQIPNHDTFHPFKRLPAEIRQEIWILVLAPEIVETAEVYMGQNLMIKPADKDVPGSVDTVTQFESPRVYVERPILMNVCNETRAVVKFLCGSRLSLDRQRVVLCRPFRVEMDVMRISCEDFYELINSPETWRNGIAAHLQHIAILPDLLKRAKLRCFGNAIWSMKNLKSLHIMYASPSALAEHRILTNRYNLFPIGRSQRRMHPGAGRNSVQWEVDKTYTLLKKHLNLVLPLRGNDRNESIWNYEQSKMKLHVIGSALR
ncbi:hypothetical protein F4819DRAFT_444047 [Hypoxylon fuscum]|nr:hypothetical protein F4819DRAFT_444047 [Hypoxylon fuscum]